MTLPKGLDYSVYQATKDGKTIYRVGFECNDRSTADEFAQDLKMYHDTNAWVWKSSVRARVVR